MNEKVAIDSYLEYFIKYQINPIIAQRKQATLKREKQIAQRTKTRRKTTIEKEIEKEEKINKEKEQVEEEKEKAANKKVVEHDDLSL